MGSEETIDLLSKAGIFTSLANEDLVRLAKLVKPKEYGQGEIIIHQGEFGNSIYFICRGSVEVYLSNQEGAVNVIGILKEGDFFGEMAILTGSPRTASVRALEDIQVMFLFKSDFDDLLSQNPHLSMTFSKILAQRIFATTKLYTHQVDKDKQLKKLISREEEQHLTHLVGKTKLFQSIDKKIDKFSKLDEPLVIIGPEGAATEDVARLIHLKSARSDQPFLTVDCGGGDAWRLYFNRLKASGAASYDVDRLFGEFQISTLFGHEAGSITGADASRMGHIELADGGVVILRNIDRLAPVARERLLFYLLEKRFFRLGAHEGHTADTLVMATLSWSPGNEDIETILKMSVPRPVWENRIDVPTLSERRRDIPLIARHCLEKHAALAGKEIQGISAQALNTLVRYSWPGNDRELERVIERGVMICEGDTLLAEHIFLGLTPYSEKGRINLLHMGLFRRIFANTTLRSAIEGVMAATLLAIVLLTFFGIQDPGRNLGSGLIWFFWWPLLLLSFLMAGRFYCSVCPIHGTTRHTRKIGSLNLPSPVFFRYIGVSIATVLGVGLFWFEEVFMIRDDPARTAAFLSMILVSAIAANVIFKPEVWCRYLCPLGFFSGAYACLSAIELRANNSVCSSQCKGTPCYKSDHQEESCPMGLFPVTLASNQFCKMCGTCVSKCPYNSIHLDLRWPGMEIFSNKDPNLITSLSIPALLGMLFPLFLREGHSWIVEGNLKFSMAFWGSVLGVTAAVALIALYQGPPSFRNNASAWGFAYLPLAFTGHLALQWPFLMRGWQWISEYPQYVWKHDLPVMPIRTVFILIGILWSLWMIGKLHKIHLKKILMFFHGLMVVILGSSLVLLAMV